MTNRRYRICAGFGHRWNTSKLEPSEKKFFCPPCRSARNKKGRPRAANSEGGKGK